jgi:hypothetical protein
MVKTNSRGRAWRHGRRSGPERNLSAPSGRCAASTHTPTDGFFLPQAMYSVTVAKNWLAASR